MSDLPLTEAFCEIVALCERLGVKAINDLDGCWEHQVDDVWWIAVNGHATETECSKGTKVPPFEAYIEFDGWPAGMISPAGGVMMMGPGEDAFIGALKQTSVSKSDTTDPEPGDK